MLHLCKQVVTASWDKARTPWGTAAQVLGDLPTHVLNSATSGVIRFISKFVSVIVLCRNKLVGIQAQMVSHSATDAMVDSSTDQPIAHVHLHAIYSHVKR
jgi:hypothetical protein